MGWTTYRKTGLTHHNPGMSVRGYTLFAQAYRPDLYLLNAAGQIVKVWHFDDLNIGHAKLLPNGNILLAGTEHGRLKEAEESDHNDFSDFDTHVLRLGGAETCLREIDFEGNIVWEYKNRRIHHDFYLCDNDDILFPEFVSLDPDFAKTVRGGSRERGINPPLVSDDIVRINRAGEEVGRWHLWQMLDPRRDPIKPLRSRREWTHTNSIELMPDGKLLVSCRNNSRVLIVDPDKHEIVWKLGDPVISLQHHATPLPNGNIQIFDNGAEKPRSIAWSKIIEVDPKTSEIVWTYEAPIREQFWSGHLSSAQRLSNGNVFICEGTSGRLFEITRSGEVVWEWITPFVGGTPGGRLYTWIYRAYRYPAEHPAFAGRDLSPNAYARLNREYGLSPS